LQLLCLGARITSLRGLIRLCEGLLEPERVYLERIVTTPLEGVTLDPDISNDEGEIAPKMKE
jgi:hypothetical protein